MKWGRKPSSTSPTAANKHNYAERAPARSAARASCPPRRTRAPRLEAARQKIAQARAGLQGYGCKRSRSLGRRRPAPRKRHAVASRATAPR
eukprot:CAMPEP_0115711674 /NCGR_PEP_ID=MMETSP0272-20121206/73696_1 /TAXON_ID=71861 /ORGANISM="Scrippsiella trochoidea, Strain CCMP3099" /LENGTH=90 /DNA_ID=CAMNT_0003153497 /DNA_START=38 /DNA_END=306 /DNA_ORIENTATION=+